MHTFFFVQPELTHLVKELLTVGQSLWLLNSGGISQGKDAAVAALHLQVLVSQDGAEVILALQLGLQRLDQRVPACCMQSVQNSELHGDSPHIRKTCILQRPASMQASTHAYV
eukprot:scaffold161261_cov22-Tisochrysis_lutea.AAC.2